MKTIFAFIALMPCFLNSVTLAQAFEEVYLAYDPDSAIFDNFGYSVDISGNYIIIGAPYESEDVNGENTMVYAGSAFIYERDENGNWNQVQKIVASDRIDTTAFGLSVGISGNYIIIGAPFNDTDSSGNNYLHHAGAAYIFQRGIDGHWSEVQKLLPSDRGIDDRFGSSVSISGHYAVVGAQREDEDTLGTNTLSNAGAAYIFQRNEDGNWNEMQKIISSDREESDYFGKAVSISDQYIIIGAPFENDDTAGLNPLESPGSAYIFELNGSKWKEVRKITAPVRNNYDNFGISVGISGNYGLVGANLESEDENDTNYVHYSGSAYIFERNSTGTWNFKQKIVASDREDDDEFGKSVDISGNYAIVGAYYEDENEVGLDSIEDAGSAYIFHRDGSTWTEIQKIVASDRGYVDYAGISIGISGNYAIMGRGDDSPHWAGAANIFESCAPGTGIDPDNIIENGEFSECIFSPWTTYTDAGVGQAFTWQLIDGWLILSPQVVRSAPQVWDMQLTQVFSPSQIDKLTEGMEYTLSFDASAQTSNRLVQVVVDLDEDPWTPVLSENILLDTEMEHYALDFMLSPKFSHMKLGFDFGSELGSIVLDNVSLIEKEPVTLDKHTISSPVIYQNQVGNYFKIVNGKGYTMKLYNSGGIVIYSAIIDKNVFIYRTDGIPEGVYIVQINSGNRNAVRKLLIH